MQIVELAARMCLACRFLYGAIDVKCIETGIRIGLQHALDGCLVSLRMDAFAVWRVGKPDRCWRGVAASAIVTHVGPQPCCFGLAIARCQDWNGGVVGVQLGASAHMAPDRVYQRAQQGAGGANPVRQQRSLQFNAFAGIDHRLPVQREVSGTGESHPYALPEPDVSLSTHPAPIVKSFVSLRPNLEIMPERDVEVRTANPMPSKYGREAACTCASPTAPVSEVIPIKKVTGTTLEYVHF